jgi:hypothetical protein
MHRIIEIEVGCCGDCPFYNWRRHKCSKGATDEGTPQDNFYSDCPMKWREKKVDGESGKVEVT